MVLSIDEKTQIQALDRTQPVLPIAFDATEKRTHDYVRHGTTNLFAALNVATGEVFGECKPTRNGANFLDFLKKAVKPHAGADVHVVLDNLSTHTTPEVTAWLRAQPARALPLHPGRLVLDQPDRDLVRHHHPPVDPARHLHLRQGLVKQIRDYIEHWNANSKPFAWTATADDILAKVQLVQTNIKKLVDNNAK